MLLLELPTGGLSDSLGRRPTLLLAYVFAVAGLATLYVADSVGGFVLATALTAIFRALDSGPLEAWYVDATHAVDPDAHIESGLVGRQHGPEPGHRLRRPPVRRPRRP